MTSNNATMPGHVLAQPAHHLFRRATPMLFSRDSIGPICANHETKCAQGDWCCDTGETCSFDTLNGAFLCCGASAGSSGCDRVCGSGTFKCGSVCCTYGQVCYGGDTVAGYCAAQTLAPVYTTTSTGGYNDYSTVRPTSTRHNEQATGTREPNEASSTSSNNHRDQQSVSSSQSIAGGGGGISIGLQIAIGVIVPLAVIFALAATWFCFRRCRRAPKVVEKDMESPTSLTPSPIPRHIPILPKNAMIVKTPVTPFEFGMPRTPKTTLPPPDTSAGMTMTTLTEMEDHASPHHSSVQSTPADATPRMHVSTPSMSTPIDLLNAMAAKRGQR